MSLARSMFASFSISVALAALIVTFHLAPTDVLEIKQDKPVALLSAPSSIVTPSTQKLLPSVQISKTVTNPPSEPVPDAESELATRGAVTKELSVAYVEAEQFFSTQLQVGSWTDYDQDTFFALALNVPGEEQARLFAQFEQALHQGQLDGLGLYKNRR